MNTRVLQIAIPLSIARDTTEKKILGVLLEEALTKREYYLSQSAYFQEKYKLTLVKFKHKTQHAAKEKFDEFDDLMEWEACDLAGKEWDKKHKDLTSCWKSSKH